MNGMFEAALELQLFLEKKKIRFCFIGGLAVLRWGEIRMTNDIDVSIACGFGNEKTYSSIILDSFNSRISDPLDFADKNRILLLYSSNNIQIDVALSGLAFEEEMIERASLFEIVPGIKLKICSAEDLIILKAFADRDKDWADIDGIVTKQKKSLDNNYIVKQLAQFAEIKNNLEILKRVKKILLLGGH